MIEALYLHVPFCVARCAYCDFATVACSDDARMDAYVDALSLQLRRAARAGLLGMVKTIYIGGGTPTHLGSRRLNSLAYMISLSVNLENVIEYTCEANPESIDERMVADLFSLGVNRFSLGAQSFDDVELAAFGRVHDARGIERAIDAVRTRTDNMSLDLICGGPGQDMRSWEETLSRAIAMDVPHMSIYPLMLEEATPLDARVRAGECTVADDDAQADMMLAAADMLERAGLHRYEVASYARPGFEARHNLAYWNGTEYLGLGAGASSMLSGATACQVAEAGIFDLAGSDAPRVRIAVGADDRSFARSGGRPRAEVELLGAREACVEDLMLGMRTSAGVPAARVVALAGAQEAFDGLVDRGLVRIEAGRYVPTERGWLMGNEVYGAIWELAS